jgi:hypothetical protein
VAANVSGQIKMAFVGLSPEEMLHKFCSVYTQFVKTLGSVFPECDATAAVIQGAEDLCSAPQEIQEACAADWNACMKKVWNGRTYYQHVKARNGDIFRNADDLNFVRDTVLWPKWTDADFNDDSKNALWMYIDQLNKHARVYFLIPRHLFDKLSGLITKFVDIDAQGNMKPTAGFNFSTVRDDLIQAMGGEAALTEQEIKDMAATMGDLFKEIMGDNNERLPEVLKMVGLTGVDPTMASLLVNQATMLMSGMGAPGSADNAASMLSMIPSELMTQLMGQMITGPQQAPAPARRN